MPLVVLPNIDSLAIRIVAMPTPPPEKIPVLVLSEAVEFWMSISPVPAAGCATKPNTFNDAELLVTVTLLLLPASTPKLFNSKCPRSMLTVVAAVDTTETPCPPLLVTFVFVIQTRPPALAILIPFWVKPKTAQFSTPSALPLRNWIPLSPDPIPLMRRFLRMTTSVAALALITIPLVPLTRTEATWPPPPSMVMAFVMVTAPNPAGSSASISPPAAVLEIAPANVLHGAVRLQGLASSPTPETQVLEAWALIMVVPARTRTKTCNTFTFSIFYVPFN